MIVGKQRWRGRFSAQLRSILRRSRLRRSRSRALNGKYVGCSSNVLVVGFRWFEQMFEPFRLSCDRLRLHEASLALLLANSPSQALEPFPDLLKFCLKGCLNRLGPAKPSIFGLYFVNLLVQCFRYYTQATFCHGTLTV